MGVECKCPTFILFIPDTFHFLDILFQFFPQYGPDYQLDISSGNRKDHNTQTYFDEILTEIEGKFF